MFVHQQLKNNSDAETHTRYLSSSFSELLLGLLQCRGECVREHVAWGPGLFGLWVGLGSWKLVVRTGENHCDIIAQREARVYHAYQDMFVSVLSNWFG